MKSNCKECGTAFFGRTDKKFCDDYCRNLHNNKLNSDSNNYVRNITNTLRKNRRILQFFGAEADTTIRRTILVDAGFNFSYYTHTKIENGRIYFFCYEYGYSKQKKECLIIKQHLNDLKTWKIF